MKFSPAFSTAVAWAAFLCLSPVAAENFTSNSGKLYKNYRVIKTSEQGMMIAHSGGVAFLLYSDVPYEVAGPYSADLKTRSGKVLKKYSVTEVVHTGFNIRHSSGSELVPWSELPPWLVERHREEAEKVQSRFIGEAIEKLPKYWNFDEAFEFVEENSAALSGHPDMTKLQGAFADYGISKMRQCKNYADGLAVFRKIIDVVSDHPKAETVKNAFADFAAGKIRQCRDREESMAKTANALTPLLSLNALRLLKINDNSAEPQILVRRNREGGGFILLVYPTDRKKEIRKRWKQISDIEYNYHLYNETKKEITRLKAEVEKMRGENAKQYQDELNFEVNHLQELIGEAGKALKRGKQSLDAAKAWIVRELEFAKEDIRKPAQAQRRVALTSAKECRLSDIRGQVVLLACEMIGQEGRPYSAWYMEYTPFSFRKWELKPVDLEKQAKEHVRKERDRSKGRRDRYVMMVRSMRQRASAGRSGSGGGPGGDSGTRYPACGGSGSVAQSGFTPGMASIAGVHTTCSTCGGTGRVHQGNTRRCPACGGRKYRNDLLSGRPVSCDHCGGSGYVSGR